MQYIKARMLPILAAFFLLCLQETPAQSYFTCISYNCENAFDTIHDNGKNDYDFLPDGSHHWSRYRFFNKLKGIMKVITASDEVRPVDLIALCEVENDTVLTYLTRKTALRRMGYRYVMTSSEDARGVDVALLYSPFTFHLVSHRQLHTSGLDVPSRDVLYASGVVENGDTVDVYVCHLPSKLGGKSAEQRGMMIAKRLREDIDSVMRIRQSPYVIVMGDFNAEVSAPVLKKVLGVRSLRAKSRVRGYGNHELIDLIANKPDGTYKYHGRWSVIDHIIVSGSFLNSSSGIVTSYEDSGIHTFPFLLEDDDAYGGKKPFRTFLWTRYNGGICDHLPVWARFRFTHERQAY